MLPLVNKYELAISGQIIGSNYISGFEMIDLIMKSITVIFEGAKSAAPQPRRDPLILDLDGDGIETVASTNGAYFDHDGNGFAERSGWVSPNDGLPVLDRNRNGTIDNGSELFGDQTILANGQKAANGFQALAELDSNHDGRIDASDADYSQLRVLRDLDGDGYSSPDELLTLSELGIASINTGYTSTNVNDGNGNTQVQTGSFTRTDGTKSKIDDVWFQTDTARTIDMTEVMISDTIAALPDLTGFGNVHDLHTAMVHNRLLKNVYKLSKSDVCLMRFTFGAAA